MSMTLNWINAPEDRKPTPVAMNYLVGGKVQTWTGPGFDVLSPIFQQSSNGLERPVLGRGALLDQKTSVEALNAALRAFDNGRGEWPTATVAYRIECFEKFLSRMESKRMEVSKLICWEIAKPWNDSLKEFDRTVEYGRATIAALRDLDAKASQMVKDSGYLAQIRRSPYGVALCMGPYNYPLNEAFATLLPALIMGNSVIAKLPRLGMLCNIPLLEAFAESFPPGVINIITGEGNTVITPLIESGKIDLLAFIGSAKVANNLKHRHPFPNRLRCVLGMGAKNPAIILQDADLDLAVRECVQGALTFNGQRCTALKILFVHRTIADEFNSKICDAISKLVAGMPFADKVFLTPLPDEYTVKKMAALVEDAVSKGAKIINSSGGVIDRTFFNPAVLYPVNKPMKIWNEEQFGPIVAVAPFDDPGEFLDYAAHSPFGQQASIFGADPAIMGKLIDALVNQVSRVNINSQCQRGPDSLPFTGRKNSAEGTLSITDALRVFSIRTLVAAKENPANQEVIQKIIREGRSQFLTNAPQK